MKVIIEMDLQETERALDAGALACLCESVKGAGLAAQSKTPAGKTTTAPGISGTDKPSKPGTGSAAKGQPTQQPPEVEAEADPEVEPEKPATSPFVDPDTEEGREPSFDTDAGEVKEYTLEEVRATMAELSKAGKKEEIKKIFASVGATKLTEVAEADYAKVMAKAAAVV